MKVEVKDKEHKHKYPWIGIHSDNNVIVLFVKSNTGVCLHRGDSIYPVGDWSYTWDEKEFNIFTGQITLSND